jgi:hypothetical protein
VRNLLIYKRIALYVYKFLSHIKARAKIEGVRERAIFERKRGEDRRHEKIT